MSIMVQNKNNSEGVPNKIGASLFLLVFALSGMFFMGIMAYSLYQGAAAGSWVETPCRITTGEIVYPQRSGSKYSYKVAYSYVYSGRNYSATRLSFNTQGSEYKNVLKLSQDYAPGMDVKCYVNPSNPSDAVLVRKVDFKLLPFMFIPLIFVAIGFGGIYLTWRKKKQAEAAVDSAVAAPLPPSPLKSARAGRYGLCVFFGIFLLVGVFAGYFMFLKPVFKIWLSSSWPQVPCVIESSRMTESSDSDGTTYGVEVIYRYQYQGTAYVGDKYDFISGTSSGHEAKARIVRNYSPGQKTFCYVNPVNPDDAVLSRTFRSDLWFGLIPGAFALVGFIGITGALRYGRKRKVHVYEQPSRSGLNYAGGFDGVGENVLKPVTTPLKSLFGTIFVAVFWNGIVSIFVYQDLIKGTNSLMKFGVSLFMIPFILIGLLLIGLVLHTLLQLFNPRPVVKLDPVSPALGGRVSLSWEIPGYRSLTRLEIKLEGSEEVKFKSGDSGGTAKKLFEQISIVDTEDTREIAAGNATFTIPAESMHSFDADSNKIIWRLKLKGRKKLLPALSYEYAVNVMPGGSSKVLKC